MARKRTADDLTVQELRRLLVEKRRMARHERLEHFRQTGRIARVTADNSAVGIEAFKTEVTGEDDPHASRRETRKRWVDGILLVIEATAVLGLLFVLFSGVNLLRNLNQEMRAALVQPTLTPTPLIVAVVLPSGHTPPDASGEARPNEAEIPEDLRFLVQDVNEADLPTPAPEQAVRIQIPAIEVDAPIIQGDGWEQLKKGVGQHLGTPNPGQNGNLVLSAHNDVYGEFFRRLDELKPGDTVEVFTNLGQYTYVITTSEIVAPTQVEVLAQTETPTLTLISCYPYLVDRQRIIVKAALTEDL